MDTLLTIVLAVLVALLFALAAVVAVGVELLNEDEAPADAELGSEHLWNEGLSNEGLPPS